MIFRNIFSFAAAIMLAVFLGSPVSAAEMGDPEKGAKVFKRCKACHQIGEDAKNRTGPQLNGIVCRVAGSVENFNYSGPMEAKAGENMVWSAENFLAYMENPSDFLGGRSKMTLKTKKEKDRVNVLAYLSQYNAEGGMYAEGEAPDGTCPAE